MEETDQISEEEQMRQDVKDVTGSPAYPDGPVQAKLAVMIDGYEVEFVIKNDQFSFLTGQITDLIQICKEYGWHSTRVMPQQTQSRPTQNRPMNQQPSPAPQAPLAASSAAPLCPVHNRPMKLLNGQFGQFWKCTWKNPDGTYCNEKASI